VCQALDAGIASSLTDNDFLSDTRSNWSGADDAINLHQGSGDAMTERIHSTREYRANANQQGC